MTENKVLPYVFTVASGFCGGLSILLVKIAAPFMSSIQILAARWTIALLAMTLLALFKVIKIDLRGKAFKPLLALVVINPCVSGICDTTGVAMTTASEASIILALMPFVVLIITRIVQGVKIHRISLIAMFMAAGGVVITKLFDETFSLGGSILGYLFLFGYMVTWAIYAMMSQKMKTDFTATEMTYLMAIAGTIWFNAIAFASDRSLVWITTSLREWDVCLALVCQGTVTTALGFLLLNYAVCRMPAAQNNMIYINMVTLTGVLLGITVLHDSWGWYTMVGLVVLVAAVILSNLPLLKKNENLSRLQSK